MICRKLFDIQLLQGWEDGVCIITSILPLRGKEQVFLSIEIWSFRLLHLYAPSNTGGLLSSTYSSSGGIGMEHRSRHGVTDLTDHTDRNKKLKRFDPICISLLLGKEQVFL